jgi:hypothetical protein
MPSLLLSPLQLSLLFLFVIPEGDLVLSLPLYFQPATNTRVPHLRRGFIAPKVGMYRLSEPVLAVVPVFALIFLVCHPRMDLVLPLSLLLR